MRGSLWERRKPRRATPPTAPQPTNPNQPPLWGRSDVSRDPPCDKPPPSADPRNRGSHRSHRKPNTRDQPISPHPITHNAHPGLLAQAAPQPLTDSGSTYPARTLP